jgi:predicted metal-dependent HD superfamily phosphohydrolase
MDLHQLFNNLLLEVGFTPTSISKHWEDLEKAYSSKSRQYHNLNHIEAMITSFEKYKEELEFPNEVLYSIFYHDIIYKTTRKDNEEKSADFAVKILPSNTTLNNVLVYDMICATKLHEKNAITDINWLIDFDLKILASDYKEYEIYCQQIRNEYKIYPDFMYKPGRKKALEHFLENEFIYQTETFRAEYETKARENILKEIDLL